MEFISGNIFIRHMAFEKAGQGTTGHQHNFDHTTYVPHGAIRFEKVRLDEAGNVVEVLKTVDKRASDGYNWVLIKAGDCHRLTALEDNSVAHCVFSHRNPQGDVVQEDDGWRASYV
jgi:hypothetical protein